MWFGAQVKQAGGFGAALGNGTIGEEGFRALLGHPSLQRLPAVLEVPGDERHGPAAADLDTARRLHQEGLALRRHPRPARREPGPARRERGLARDGRP